MRSTLQIDQYSGEGKQIVQETNVKVYEAATDTAKPTQRFERKFFVLPRNTGFAFTLLRHVCRPDREYPEGRINSLYFDTPDLEQYTRSESGEFNKDKVRIRWYGEIKNSQEMNHIFLELKSRQGFASSKQRQRFTVSPQTLKQPHLSGGIIDKTTIVDALARFGHYPKLSLKPIIVISYRRYRFNEISTGIRVSLDYNIRSTVVVPGLGRGERELRLQGGIIEVKGPTLELPETIRRIKVLDTDWSRFSKYGQCIDSHLSGPGTVARLWPSGRGIDSWKGE